MNKLLLLIILMLPMLLLANGSADTAYIARLDLTTNPTDGVSGFDYEIWGTYHYDTTYDTNLYGEVNPVLNFVEDSIVWDGTQISTLYLLPHIEIGKYNVFALELIGDVCSLQTEFLVAATLADFDRKPWEWRVDTTLTCEEDSIFDKAVLCIPFTKYIKWRLIDLAGKARTFFFRFKLKESG